VNEPLCHYCGKPMHLNQARVRLAKFPTDAHKKCWEQNVPATTCWECDGEGRLPGRWVDGKGTVDWRVCPRCKGRKVLR